MLAITRALARQLQAVLRKSVFARTPKGIRPPVVLQAGPDGLRVRARHHDAAVEYHQPGPTPPKSSPYPQRPWRISRAGRTPR